MVVPSGKKVELVSLVMEADCRDENDFSNIIDSEEGEGERVEKGGPVLSVEVEKEVENEENIQGSMRVDVLSNANAGEKEEEAVHNSPLSPEVPLLHQVLYVTIDTAREGTQVENYVYMFKKLHYMITDA